MKNCVLVFLLLVSLSACKNNTGKVSAGDTLKRISSNKNEDSFGIIADSLERAKEADCYTRFFANPPFIDTNNITVISDEVGKLKLGDFIKEQGLEREYLNITLKDVDNDSIQELWIRNFTMGAHCCDEFYVFLKQPSGVYKQSSKLFAGDVCVADSIFTYSFDEAFGYFMSCFACGFEDSAKGFVTMREIRLRYTKGKFELIPYSSKEEEQLMKNLAILKQEGVEPISEDQMDSGVRKEFAMNLIVYYYNHQKNLDATKKLFDTYYIFKDARKVWKEFVSYVEDFKANHGI